MNIELGAIASTQREGACAWLCLYATQLCRRARSQFRRVSQELHTISDLPIFDDFTPELGFGLELALKLIHVVPHNTFKVSVVLCWVVSVSGLAQQRCTMPSCQWRAADQIR